MEDDVVTRVRYRDNPNFLQRLGRSFGGLLIGLVLLLGGCALLFWNEGRAVTTARSLEEGLRTVRRIDPKEEGLEHGTVEGELVHLSGPLYTPTDLTDEQFAVSVRAVALRRVVEMFQWVEHRETREVNEGQRTREETRFTYTKEWRAEVVDSRGFERIHPNPQEFPVPAREWRSHLVKVRGLILSEGLVSRVDRFRTLPAPPAEGFLVHGEFLYRGRDPYEPVVGDVRVRFEAAGRIGSEDETVSIVARRQLDRLVEHETESGGTLELLYFGEWTAEKMFAKEMADNQMMTWGIRLAGWLLLFIALCALTEPVRVLVDWLPIVRELVSLGLGTFNFFLSSSLAVFVIALGWIRYRPLLGWSLLLLAVSPYILGRLRRARGLSSREAQHVD